MVNVISKNKFFNISNSLYESILKNNPELLNEDKKDRTLIATALEKRGFDPKKISIDDMDKLEKKFINDRGNLFNIIDDYLEKKDDELNNNDLNNDDASHNNFSDESKSESMIESFIKGIGEKNIQNILDDDRIKKLGIGMSIDNGDISISEKNGKKDDSQIELFNTEISKKDIIKALKEKMSKEKKSEEQLSKLYDDKNKEKANKVIEPLFRDVLISIILNKTNRRNYEEIANGNVQNTEKPEETIKYDNRKKELENKEITKETLNYINNLQKKYKKEGLADYKEYIKTLNEDKIDISGSIWILVNKINELTDEFDNDKSKKNENKYEKNLVEFSDKVIDYIIGDNRDRKDISKEKISILSYISDEEFSQLLDTLTEKQTEEQKTNQLNELTIRYDILKDIVEKYTFDSKVNSQVTEFLKYLNDDILHNRLYGGFQYKLYNFGESSPKGFIIDKPKQIYVDIKQSSKVKFNDIPEYRIFQLINENVFWKNVSYIHCLSKNAYNIVRNAIGEVVSARKGLNYKQRYITTGLNTNTYAIILEPDDSKTDLYNVESREGGKLFNNINEYIEKAIEEKKSKYINNGKKVKNNKIKEDVNNDNQKNEQTNKDVYKEEIEKAKKLYEKSISNMDRIYFIIVSEGLFNKMDAFNKMKNFVGKMTNNDSGDYISKLKNKMGGIN